MLLKVHMIYESPVHCYHCDKHEGVFNLSVSYRKDSDFTSIYYTDSGIYWDDELSLQNKKTNMFRSKNDTRLAATLISNCESKRLLYINEVQKFTDVDIYGKCSGQECPNDVDCRHYLSKLYKFFFVFENSICTDYITEKFFDTFKYDIVPIVIGKIDFDFWIPRSGYINALDFESPEALAIYLQQLDRDEIAYNKFFEWKEYLRIDKTPPIQSYLCEMCIQLNLEEVAGVVKNKVLTDVVKMYNNNENCWGIDTDHSKIVKGSNLQNLFFMSPETNFDRYRR